MEGPTLLHLMLHLVNHQEDHLWVEMVDLEALAELERTGEQRSVLLFLPLYHAYGLVAVLTLGAAAGAKLVVLPKFEPKSYLSAIEKYKVQIKKTCFRECVVL